MQYTIWLALVLFIGSSLTEQGADEKYDELFQKIMECYPTTAALGISAVKDGKVVFNKAYGKASIEKDIDNSINTRFSIGSVTKQFTSYLAGKKIAEGHFYWTDKIRDVFKKYGVHMSLRGHFRNAVTTVADALTHMTGIKQCEWLLTDDRNLTRAQWMTQILSNFEEQKEMRAAFYYNNWFYTLIGWLSELVGDASFENQVKEQIFEPLGMGETMFVTDPEFDDLTEEELAQPYKESSDETTLYPIPKRALKHISYHNPAGGIVSTTGDMAKYMIAVIDALNDGDGAILDKDVLSTITEPKVTIGHQLGDPVVIEKPTFPQTFMDQGYGYGHIIGTYKGYKYMYHGGSTYGHYSYITFLPDLNMGVFSVISGNDYLVTDTFRIQKLMHIFSLDNMMGETSWIDTTNACTFPNPWIKLKAAVGSEDVAPAEGDVGGVRAADGIQHPEPELHNTEYHVEEAESYVGNYSNTVFPLLEIKQEPTGGLTFTMGNSNGSIESTRKKGLLSVILNMPVDPLNLPNSEKRRASLTFKYNDDSKVSGLVFGMSLTPEEFAFEKNDGVSQFYARISSAVLIVLVCVFY